MFTGIIKTSIQAKKIVKSDSSIEMTFPIPKGWHLGDGESLNIDGICSTVTDLTKDTFKVFYMAETLRKTNLKQVLPTHQFNLERSLTLSNLVSGHLVSGHVDTTAQVKMIIQEGLSKTIIFKFMPPFRRYLVYKGSVAVNGVSLTVAALDKVQFRVSLIPQTLSQTNLKNLKVGDVVNLEFDLIGKYLENFSKVWPE